MTEPGRFHVYRGTPCVPGTDPRECPGCHQEPSDDGTVRFRDDGLLEMLWPDGLWRLLQRLPDVP